MQYEDEDGDKVVLATDSDLAAAVDHARLSGWKVMLTSLSHLSISFPRIWVIKTSGIFLARILLGIHPDFLLEICQPTAAMNFSLIIFERRATSISEGT